MAPEATALGDIDPAAPIGRAIAINAMTLDGVSGPELRASWSWAPGLITEPDERALADACVTVLERLVSRASQPGGATPTPMSHSWR